MKRILHVIAITFVAFSIMACEKQVVQNAVEDNDSVEILLENSIQFETGVSTKGELFTGDHITEDFSVYGYVYRSSWEAATAMAKPNVFITSSEDQTNEDPIYEAPKTVTYNSGFYEYSPIVQWTGYKYSFFAFYPASTSDNTNIIIPSDENVEGDPYVTIKVSRSSTQEMVDLMTASYIDTDANSSKTVPLNFHHRLTAVDVGALNYCEYDPDPNNNDATDVMPVTIQISQVDFAVENLLYDESKISLNREIASVSKNNESTGLTTASYSLQTYDKIYSNDKLIGPNSDGDILMRPITSSENQTTMILIPQETPLKVTPSIRYYKRLLPDEDGQARFVDHDGSIKYMTLTDDENSYAEPPTYTYGTEFSFDRPLLEGRRYYIQLNFTSDAVSVNIVAADEWQEVPRVDHEFM